MKLTRVKATPCGALIGPNNTKTPPSLSLSSLSLSSSSATPHFISQGSSLGERVSLLNSRANKKTFRCSKISPPTVSAPLSDLRNEKRMAENFPENLPMPSSADPVSAPDFFAAEFTRTDSDSSAITLDFSKDAWLRCDYALQVNSWLFFSIFPFLSIFTLLVVIYYLFFKFFALRFLFSAKRI